MVLYKRFGYQKVEQESRLPYSISIKDILRPEKDCGKLNHLSPLATIYVYLYLLRKYIFGMFGTLV